MAGVAVLTVHVDARDFERALEQHTERMRALVEQHTTHDGRAAAALGALALVASRRRVSRRELLGLGWLRPTGGGSKSLPVNDAADRAAGHFARVQQMKTPIGDHE